METGKESIIGNDFTSLQNDQSGSNKEVSFNETTKSSKVIYDSFNSKLAKRIGIVQILAGIVALFLNIAQSTMTVWSPYTYIVEVDGRERRYDWDDTYYDPYSYFPGVWGGLIVVGCGICMICSGKTKSLRAILTLFIFSVLGDLLGLGMLALSCWALKMDISRVSIGMHYYFPDGEDRYEYTYYGLPDVAVPRAVASCIMSILFAVMSCVILGTCIKGTIMSVRTIKIKDLKCSPCSCFCYVSTGGKDNMKPTVIFLGPQNDQQTGIIQIGNKKYTLTPMTDPETNKEPEVVSLIKGEVA